jgi:hypothetical protein
MLEYFSVESLRKAPNFIHLLKKNRKNSEHLSTENRITLEEAVPMLAIITWGD